MYMKVLLFCCKGFEMMEFSAFYDVCGWAKSEYGFDMQVDVCGFTKVVHSAFWRNELKVDRLIEEISAEEYDAIAISGGDYLYGFRYSGAYSLLIQSFIPVHESSSLISAKSVVILPKRRYLEFSVAFFHTQEYLFAFASNLDPSMYRC